MTDVQPAQSPASPSSADTTTSAGPGTPGWARRVLSTRGWGSGSRLAGAVSSGALLRLAFPEPGIGALALPAVALLLASLHGVTARRGAGLAMVHGAVFYVSLLPWLQVIGVDAWLLLSAVCVAWSALLGALLAWASVNRAWIALSAGAWVAVETLRSSVPLGGFSWGRLAFAEPWALTAFARWLGAPGVSAMTVVTAGLAILLVRRLSREPDSEHVDHADSPRSARTAVLMASALVLLLTVPSALLSSRVSADEAANPSTTTVAVIQGNVPRLGLDFNAQRRAVLQNHVDVTLQLAADIEEGIVSRPEFVLWPENASDIDPFRDATARQLIDTAVAAVGVPVIVGAVLDNGDNTLSNAGIVWDPTAGPTERYSKRHLVPFGEYVPGRELLARFISRFDRVGRDFVPGDAAGNLPVAGRIIGTVMCFEVAYDNSMRDVARESDMLAVQTNNATYGLSGQPAQQLAITRLRAIEHGRVVLVAATTGVSGIIRADGTLATGGLAEFTQGYRMAEVTSGQGVSAGSSVGAVLEWSSLAFAVFVVVWGRRRANMAQAGSFPGRKLTSEVSGT
jgi:apolipoprotein N-acyltransferase